jgi:transcription-repair coupling factor (superfamily II helicase)
VPHFRTLTEISFELARRIPPLYAAGPVFFLAQSDKEAKQLLSLCRYWNASFPEGVIISELFLQEHTVSEKYFTEHTLVLKPGRSTTISELANQLVRLGFERYPRAVAERSFAVRGNIIDVVDRQSVRLEFGDNAIAHINLFNPSTQASGQTLYEAIIWPLDYAAHLPLWHEHDLTDEFVTPKYYHKRFSLLKHEASNFITLRVATKRSIDVRELLPNAKITPPERNLEGFIWPKEHYAFLTDDHIFGQEEVLHTFAQAMDPSDVEPGDYVVHIDHGIGLFERMKEIVGEPYFELHYLRNDKLYVPLDKANRLEKYVGGSQPKLTSLSGTQWEAIVHKVKEDIRQTAKELLLLHAKRTSTKTTAIALAITSEELACARDAQFELTPDQAQAIDDIIHDLHDELPMDRLLCGDVGFGKTEVALRAALHAVMHNQQVLLLAPTTILAQQHYETFHDRLGRFGVNVAVLSRLQTGKIQSTVVRNLRAGKIDIIIGTHRLLSADIAAPRLNFIIIDEEQRFGVLHKERLKNLRAAAHVLTMTATPIPRTLNLALSGLRDISVLNTAPPQRQGVTTIIETFNPDLELEAIRTELERGGQIYVVHNDIGTLYARQSYIQQYLSKAHVAIAHGQLPPDQLVKVMEQFHQGKVDVLVASTIIENGLDITNANTLVVEHAEDFGLAQLYQLRGRIGRGSSKAYAYLLYTPDNLTKQGKERLRALRKVKELGGGFELAMKDLEIRGVGDILGKKQHGHVQQIGLNLYNRLLHQAIVQLQESSQG